MSMYDDFGDDDFGDDDDFGASDAKVARLLKRKAKLEALLQVVGPARAQRIQQRLYRINALLAKMGVTEQMQASGAALAASGIEGIGGLQFQAASPPGVGRLLRLPFYANGTIPVSTTVTTSQGLSTPSATNPVLIFSSSGLNAGSGIVNLATPQISWAVLRLVGFETQAKNFKAIQNPGAQIEVQQLKIGGGANLFTHEAFAPAHIYDANQPEFCGLRDYPIIRSPNFATVQAAMVNAVATETTTFSCSLLVEALIDDQYGAHIPSPAARRGAMVRAGGSFAC
jgi:hypothetical protein